MRTATMFRDKRDLMEWLERELPEDAQYMAPGLLGFKADAASKRHPAPRLQADLIFPTDSLTESSPADDVSWLAGGPRSRIRAFIPIIMAQAGTFQEVEDAT